MISRLLLILKRLAAAFIMRQENIKHQNKIGLQCLYTIPQCPTFLHDDQIDFNKNKNVFRALDVNPTSETWFLNKYIEDEIKRKSRKKREDNLQVMKWHMILDNT